jgi:hypothetical protein
MKVQIPDQLKSDVPHTMFGRVLAATPVVMAVVATMLAGLASSEMTRAQYDRSLAAQEQSKAGDQWSFFQAKRVRGSLQQNTAELLQSLTEVRPLDPGALRQWAKGQEELAARLDSPAAQQALGYLQRGEVPAAAPGPALDPQVKKALDGLAALKTDAEMAALLAPVSNALLEETLRHDQDTADAFDAATKPINAAVDQLDSLLARTTIGAATTATATGPSPLRDFTAARMRYTAARYEVEARLNQSIANLYELQVRKSNISAERHHARSQKFFCGMLAAQLGVIVATFAIAARKRNLLWSLAAAAGLLAVSFAVFVYLYT